MTVQDVVAKAEALYEDLDFQAVSDWKAQASGRKAIGYMPIYVPREIIHAAGMLPVGVLGGGDRLEVIHGDAFYQSYICRIPRSTVELGVTGRLDCLDGMLFPSICDVIRNLSGMWQMMYPEKYARYFDVPQNFSDSVGGDYYLHELQQLRDDLAALAGHDITDAALTASIKVYNENRRAIGRLYDLRSSEPWRVRASDVFLLLRAGMLLPVETHTALLEEYIAAAEAEARPKRDNCRVILHGSFCEQPPLSLIKSIEMAGCYIVDDDLLLITRWMLQDVPEDGDPMQNLAQAFLHHSTETSAKYQPCAEKKGAFLIDNVAKRAAEGVIFAAPSFCDPALLDRPMMQDALAEAGIPYTAFKYAENSGQMQPIREQAGTFADSIKLWSA